MGRRNACAKFTSRESESLGFFASADLDGSRSCPVRVAWLGGEVGRLRQVLSQQVIGILSIYSPH